MPVIADLDLKAAEATASEIKAKGADAFAVAMNVADEAQVEKGVADTVAKYGKVDILRSRFASSAKSMHGLVTDRVLRLYEGV